MSPAAQIDARTGGICHSCQHHTRDGIVRFVEQGTRIGRVLHCADVPTCKRRAAER